MQRWVGGKNTYYLLDHVRKKNEVVDFKLNSDSAYLF